MIDQISKQNGQILRIGKIMVPSQVNHFLWQQAVCVGIVSCCDILYWLSKALNLIDP